MRFSAARVQGLSCLDVLDLHSNAVSDLCGLAPLTSLRILNLANNRVAHLGKHLPSFFLVKTFRISNFQNF